MGFDHELNYTPPVPLVVQNEAPALTPPPETGDVMAPSGCGLYWKMTEQGREWFSDECGPISSIWHTALVNQSTLLLAMVKEAEFQYLEAEIRKRKTEDKHRKIMDDINASFLPPEILEQTRK